jgi:hypothetical protein
MRWEASVAECCKHAQGELRASGQLAALRFAVCASLLTAWPSAGTWSLRTLDEAVGSPRCSHGDVATVDLPTVRAPDSFDG